VVVVFAVAILVLAVVFTVTCGAVAVPGAALLAVAVHRCDAIVAVPPANEKPKDPDVEDIDESEKSHSK
jgi:hypothetical protein